MTEAQVWTLVGVFAAIMLGMALMTTLLMWKIRTTFAGPRAKPDSSVKSRDPKRARELVECARK